MTAEHPFKSVRRAGCPLVGYETPDAQASMREIIGCLNGKGREVPICLHDLIRGLVGVNELGVAYAGEVSPEGPIQSSNPTECLSILAKTMPERAIVFMLNAHREIEDGQGFNPGVSMGLFLCRSRCEEQGATIVLMAPALKLPPELQRDVVVITEELPDATVLGAVVDSLVQDAVSQTPSFPAPGAEERDRIVETLRGLSVFEARQALGLSVSKGGIDREKLWGRKRRAIEATPGLEVWTGGERFSDLGGLGNLKAFLTRILTSGNTPVRAIFFWDELEKMLSGAVDGGGDGGASKDQLGMVLRLMQDKVIPGLMLVGPAGTGKSSIAKGAGNVAGVPVIAWDFGAMKSRYVGDSEERIRAAVGVAMAISQGNAIVIATCNKLASLPPEVKRRFSLGTFFVDLPTDEEQAFIWPIWMAKYGLKEQPLPPCKDWTGAEIRACCDVAYRGGMTLVEASSFVVPVCKSGADSISQLRKVASQSFISASYAGVYRLPVAQETTKRVFGD